MSPVWSPVSSRGVKASDEPTRGRMKPANMSRTCCRPLVIESDSLNGWPAPDPLPTKTSSAGSSGSFG